MIKSILKYTLGILVIGFFAIALVSGACFLFFTGRVSSEEDIGRRIARAMAGRPGAFCAVTAPAAMMCGGDFDERYAPCSTFKIWHTLIGLECGVISSPDEPFYRWDGTPQPVKDWERDLTLREAFRVSCVPAYRDLAREIGIERMNEWLDKIGYGDRDTSAGVDAFWLPGAAAERRAKPLTISPLEQQMLMSRLVKGDLPVSKKSLATLKEIMFVAATPAGKLYGKTGSSGPLADGLSLGWYVGYFEGKDGARPFVFLLREKDVAGKDARAIAEKVFFGK